MSSTDSYSLKVGNLFLTCQSRGNLKVLADFEMWIKMIYLRAIILPLQVYEEYALKSNNILLANVTDFSSLPNPLFILSKSNEIRIVLNDTAKYNSTCRPQNYPKINLSYETIVS